MTCLFAQCHWAEVNSDSFGDNSLYSCTPYADNALEIRDCDLRSLLRGTPLAILPGTSVSVGFLRALRLCGEVEAVDGLALQNFVGVEVLPGRVGAHKECGWKPGEAAVLIR